MSKQSNEEKCGLCGKQLTFWNKSRLKFEGKWICSTCSFKNIAKDTKSHPKKITETKATCQACGNVWFYGKSDRNEQLNNSMANCGKGMMCCTCSPIALLIPDKKITDLNKCPKCGSRAVKNETVTHNV